MAWARGALGEFLVWSGELDEARELALDHLEMQLAATEAPGAEAPTYNFAAWSLLEMAPADLRDTDRALELAERANELAGHPHPGYLHTLALAHQSAGRTSDAIETLREALPLLPDAPSPLRQLLEEHLAEFEARLAEGEAALEQNAGDD